MHITFCIIQQVGGYIKNLRSVKRSMETLSKEYVVLFQGISETIDTLEATIGRLKTLQAAAEEMYLDRCDKEDVLKVG